MASINNYYNVGTQEVRGYFPEGINSITTSLSLNVADLTIPGVAFSVPVYTNVPFLLPFYIRKLAKNIRICLPITAIQSGGVNGTVTFGLYSPTDEKTMIGSQKIFEVSLFNNTIPTTGLHVVSAPANLALKPGWVYLAILIQGNKFSCPAYSNSVFRSIRGNIAYSSSNQIRDISSALATSLAYSSFTSTYTIQIAKAGDNTFPSTSYDNIYTSLPNSIHNYVEKSSYSTPLAYLIY